MIIHVDMDAFYASVEQRDNPELRGKPVVVGGSAEGRGVVSAASYEARRFGIHSAMPMKTAMRLCRELISVRTRMEHYVNIARQILEIFHRYTPLVEPLALDEAFLDARGSETLFGSSIEIGKRIRDEIRTELQLASSVGVAPNKFLAKVASGHDKPNGFVVVRNSEVHEFLDPLCVSKVWGVGGHAQQRLANIGIHSVGHLRRRSVDQLKKVLGEASARHLHDLAWGRDNRKVVPDREAKSISHETTFSKDVADSAVLRECLLRQTELVLRRLRGHKRFCSSVHLKIRFSDFRTFTRSLKLKSATDSTDLVWEIVKEQLLPRIDLTQQAVRLVGVGVSLLSDHRIRQMQLFGTGDGQHQRVDEVTDSILDRFGKESIQRGGSLRRKL